MKHSPHLLLLTSCFLSCQKPEEGHVKDTVGNNPKIFMTGDISKPLEVTMNGDFSKLFSYLEKINADPKIDPDDFSLPVRIPLNGKEYSFSMMLNGRSSLQICGFPNLKFKGEGGEKWYITTHCAKKSFAHKLGNDEDAIRTWIANRIYSTLSSYALQTRLLKVTYNDIGKQFSGVHYAFTAEDLSILAQRTGSQVDNPTPRAWRVSNDKNIDAEQVLRTHLFNIMIQNDDWDLHDINMISIQRAPNYHNLLGLKKGTLEIPVAIDFDLGTFTTPARPLGVSKRISPEIAAAKENPILARTRQYIKEFKEIHQSRLNLLPSMVTHFRSKETTIRSMIQESPANAEGKQNMLAHVDAFYSALKKEFP